MKKRYGRVWKSTRTFWQDRNKLGLCYVQAWTSERLWIRVLLNQRLWKPVLSCQHVLVVVTVDMKVEVPIAHAKCSNCGKTEHLEKMCRQGEKSDVKSTSSSSSGKGSGKGVKAVPTPTSAVVVYKSAIEDLIVLIAMKVASAEENETLESSVSIWTGCERQRSGSCDGI